jgi:hypothetical protein
MNFKDTQSRQLTLSSRRSSLRLPKFNSRQPAALSLDRIRTSTPLTSLVQAQSPRPSANLVAIACTLHDTIPDASRRPITRDAAPAVALARIFHACIREILRLAEIDALLHCHVIPICPCGVQRALACNVLAAPDILVPFARRHIDVSHTLGRGLQVQLWCCAIGLRGRGVGPVGDGVAAREGRKDARDLFVDHGGQFAFLCFALRAHGETGAGLAVGLFAADVECFLESGDLPAVDLRAVSEGAS